MKKLLILLLSLALLSFALVSCKGGNDGGEDVGGEQPSGPEIEEGEENGPPQGNIDPDGWTEL